MRRHKQKALSLLALLLCLSLTVNLPVRADQTSELENDVNRLEEEKREEEAKAARLREREAELESELESALSEMDETIDRLRELDGELRESGERLAYYSAQKEEREAALQEQKAAMGLRIQYMYELQTASFWEILAGSSSLGEVLNSADYISSISSYDREMQQEYRESLTEAERLTEEAEAERAALEVLRQEVKEKQESIEQRSQELSASLESYEAEIAAAGSAAEALSSEISGKRTQISVLAEAARRAQAEAAAKAAQEEADRRAAQAEAEAKAAAEAAERAAEEAARRAEEEAAAKAAEEAARRAEEEAAAARQAAEDAERQRQEEESAEAREKNLPLPSDARGSGSLDIDPDALNASGYTNLELLAAIIDCEAGNQSYEGRVAIGNVIFNRIRDPRFQMTIYDVVYAPNQFTPAYSGTLRLVMARGARAECIQAARDCLDGVRVIEEKWLYFCNKQVWDAYPKNYKEYMTLEAHYYYY